MDAGAGSRDALGPLRPFLSRDELRLANETGVLPVSVVGRATSAALAALEERLAVQFNEEFWRRYDGLSHSLRAQLGLVPPPTAQEPRSSGATSLFDSSVFC